MDPPPQVHSLPRSVPLVDLLLGSSTPLARRTCRPLTPRPLLGTVGKENVTSERRVESGVLLLIFTLPPSLLLFILPPSLPLSPSFLLVFKHYQGVRLP